MNSLILTILFTIISIIFLYIAIKAKKNYIQILCCIVVILSVIAAMHFHESHFE